MKHLVFFSVPFHGHFDILHKFALQLRSHYEITFIICGWDVVPIPSIDASLHSAIVTAPIVPPSAPMEFTWERVDCLIDRAVALCRTLSPIDFIVYDFFCLEGLIVSHCLRVPSACSIPAIFGDSIDKAYLERGIHRNLPLITSIERRVLMSLQNKISMVSDGFLLEGDINLLWVPKDLYRGVDLGLRNTYFLNIDPPSIHANRDTIYVCFGTVVTGNLCKNNPSVREYLIRVYQEIIDVMSPRETKIVMSIPYLADEIKSSLIFPSNVSIESYVDQPTILSRAKLVIFHGGGNTLREALQAKVPMVVIPFFGDQHATAKRVNDLGLGIGVYSEESNIDTRKDYSIRSIAPVTSALNDIWTNLPHYTDKSLPFALTDNFTFPPVLHWCEGDLLFGTNPDRKHLSQIMGLEDFFQIGNMKPFSQWGPTEALPRLIDQYNDALRDPSVAATEMASGSQYSTWLREYRDYLQPLDRIPGWEQCDDLAKEMIWSMCISGMEFLLYKKKIHIQNEIETFNCHLNRATTLELKWIKQHWSQVGDQIHFYTIIAGEVKRIKPDFDTWLCFH